jgi:hypothetical protein
LQEPAVLTVDALLLLRLHTLLLLALHGSLV